MGRNWGSLLLIHSQILNRKSTIPQVFRFDRYSQVRYPFLDNPVSVAINWPNLGYKVAIKLANGTTRYRTTPSTSPCQTCFGQLLLDFGCGPPASLVAVLDALDDHILSTGNLALSRCMHVSYDYLCFFWHGHGRVKLLFLLPWIYYLSKPCFIILWKFDVIYFGDIWRRVLQLVSAVSSSGTTNVFKIDSLSSQWLLALEADWWYTYPSEKYESVGMIIPNWMGK